MTDLKWLQGQIPAPDWEKLNNRRKTAGMKWPELLQVAVDHYLQHIEAGEIIVTPPVTGVTPPATPKTDKKDTTKSTSKPSKAGQKKAGKKPKSPRQKNTNAAGDTPLTLTPTAEDVAELAIIEPDKPLQ